MKAYLFDVLEENKVKCRLCNHRCVIKPGKRGICGVRENREGQLSTRVFGRLIARHVDPIEKKPIFHMYPGSLSYSIATVGCNFRCRFCQNAEIAQMPNDRRGEIQGKPATPEEIVADAVKAGCKSISYTYTEPTVYFEFAYETAKLANKTGLKNIFVTNGYMSIEALEMISPFLDAANVDLKGYTEEFYKTWCGAKLSPVKDTIVEMKKRGIWVEVTTLIIPGLNDAPEEIEEMARFISESAGPDTPWHISRFHPTYKLTDRPVTPVETLFSARSAGIGAGLRYVYTGNIPGRGAENTFCSGCGNLLIERWGFAVSDNRIQENRCPDCRTRVDGVGMDGSG